MKLLGTILLAILLFQGCSDTNGSTNTPDTDLAIAPLANNPLFEEQWAINPNETFYAAHTIDADAHINPQNVFETYSGRGIRVAVIDDGFDLLHPDLEPNIVASFNVQNIYTTTDASHTLSTDYHGTAVAGIIGAKNNTLGITGIASNVELILIKIPMDEYTDLIGIRAFELAEQYGADIISCSWGTGDVSDAVKAKITEIATQGREGKGALIVFAAGNTDALIGNDESAIESVVAVGATDHTALRASYSSYGATLDIVAPGGYALGISTLDPRGSAGVSVDDYNRFDEQREGSEVSFIGTSAAAPIVSGVLALALEANPEQTRLEVFENLKHAVTYPSENLPYLYDSINSQTDMPTVSGTFGSSGFSEFNVRFIAHNDTTIHGPYSITSVGNNEWQASCSETLPQGNYTIEVISPDASTVYATDDDFTIDSTKATTINYNVKRNDYYGYGKIDLAKLMSANSAI